MKTLLQLLFLLLLCAACSSNEKQQQHPKDYIEIDMVPLIEGEAKEMPLQEWAKSVRFIPLDEDANVSFKSIKNIFQRGDTLLVHHLGKLTMFDADGKFLYHLDLKASGPQDDTHVRFACLHNDLIYALVGWTSIKVYNWKGEFIKKLELPSNVWDVLTLSGKEEMLAYVANHKGEEPVRFYRMKGEEVLDTVFNPFIYKRPKDAQLIIDYECEFQRSAGSLEAFIELGSDTLYRVDEHLRIYPYIVFNMGKHLYSREQRYSETSEEWEKRMMEGNECYLNVAGEIDDKVFIYNNRERSNFREVLYVGDTYCYDKATKETSKYFLTYGENDWGISPDAYFEPRTIVEDKYLVDWEQPDNDENPVLILVEP